MIPTSIFVSISLAFLVSTAFGQEEAVTAKPEQQGQVTGFKNIATGIGTDVVNKYKGQFNIFNDIATSVGNGDSPAKIIKETIHKHPAVLKNFTFFTAVCQLPTMRRIPFFGPICTKIDDQANKFISLIDGLKPVTGMVVDKVDSKIKANEEKKKKEKEAAAAAASA